MLTLEKILKLGKKSKFAEFYLPIEPDNKNWLREIIQGGGSEEEKLQAIKTSSVLQKGQIVRFEVGELGLPVLLYLDRNGILLDKFEEMTVYYATGPGPATFRTLDELEDWEITYMKTFFTYNKHEPGFGRREIRRKSGKVDEFNVENQTKDGFGGSRSFKKEDYECEVSYSVSVDPDLQIKRFEICIEMKEKQETKVSSSMIVERSGSQYMPRAEVRLPLPQTAEDRELGGSWARYTFGNDGCFVSIKAGGMEFVGAEAEKNLKFYREYGVLDALEKKPIEEIPAAILADLRRISLYNTLRTYFVQSNPFFKVDPEAVQLDYVSAILKMAEIATAKQKPPQFKSGGRNRLRDGGLTSLIIAGGASIIETLTRLRSMSDHIDSQVAYSTRRVTTPYT